MYLFDFLHYCFSHPLLPDENEIPVQFFAQKIRVHFGVGFLMIWFLFQLWIISLTHSIPVFEFGFFYEAIMPSLVVQ